MLAAMKDAIPVCSPMKSARSAILRMLVSFVFFNRLEDVVFFFQGLPEVRLKC